MTVHFIMNDAYLRQFHTEMVRTRLPRWRSHERVANLSLVSAVVLFAWSIAAGRLDVTMIATVVAVVGLAMRWRLHRRKERWLAYQRRLPTYGASITTVVDRGRLVQRSDKQTDVVAIPCGEILESRNGWFVTYDVLLLGTEVTDASVNTKRASAYLPESGFEPGTTRDTFAAALASTFEVRRLRASG